jgi:gamma-glutamyltranspeptidase/glutathione hydrolase
LFQPIRFEFQSRRSPLISRRGMVATSQPLAVAAGLKILSQGGNAADAAVATAAALNVTEPVSTGIGGDCFALYYDAGTRQISALNASGRAPQSLTLERLGREGLLEALPPFHPYTVTVPGACAGWCDMVSRHGTLGMGEVLAPAIRLAEEGFPVAPVTARAWKQGFDGQLRSARGGMELTIEGRAPRPGEIFRNPGLARTFREVAEGGKQAFYQGEIAAAIAETVQSAGGCLSVEDLAAHYGTWAQPISVTYRDLRVWECPPNGQGLTALLALNILEGFDVQASPPLSAERLHLEVEALRLAFADSRWYVTDLEAFPVPVEDLLSKAYAAERRRLIDPRKAAQIFQHGALASASDTVYLSVVDERGNACSFINSNYMGFGTGIVPAGWGFSLQNRGHNFNLHPDHPNALAPGKRPYHTIIPAMATRLDGSLFASFGVMGGFMQPQGHLQVVVALSDDRLDPQSALDRPRFCLVDGTSDSRLALETGIPAPIMVELSDMGHQVSMVEGHDRAVFGRGQVIVRDVQDGTSILWGGSDPRADGCVMSAW